MPSGQTHQERNLTILSTPFYEARQVRHFMKQTKHAFYEARQTRKRAKFIDHANMPSTRARQAHKARYLADSILSFTEQFVLK